MDDRYEVAYREAVRGLDAQAQVLEQLRGRAGTLFSAAGVVTGILGVAVDDLKVKGLPDKIALATGTVAFLVLTVAAGVAWWPFRGRFRVDPRLIIRDYIEDPESLTLDEMHRDLALRHGASAEENAELLDWRLAWFRAALIAFAVLVASLVVLLLEVK